MQVLTVSGIIFSWCVCGAKAKCRLDTSALADEIVFMLRKLGYSTLVFLLFLGVAELGSRVIESQLAEDSEPGTQTGWQQEFFGSVFDWHEPDPDLLWRFKANLDNPLIKTNSQHLIGEEITHDREPGSVRVLLLGDSSPVGLGLASHRQTFGEILKYILTVGFGGRRTVEVINAAVSGYTSEQIRRFLELRGWDLKPDIVILYCGNNDASISGPLSDQQLLESQKLKKLRSTLGHSAFYRLARALLAGSSHDSDGPVQDLKIRVSPARFAENITSISEQCREHSCPLIVIKPPVPRLWPAGLQFRAFQHVKGRSGSAILPDAMTRIVGRDIKYCLDQNMFDSLYGRGDLFTREVYASAYRDTVAPLEAKRLYTSPIDSGRTDPIVYNNLGVSYWESGDYNRADSLLRYARELYEKEAANSSAPAVVAAGSPILFNIGINLLSRRDSWEAQISDSVSPAAIYLDSALQADFFSLRIKRSYLNVIDSLSHRQDFAVVDLPELFALNGGERLFIDHCHPTVDGHVLIARALAEKVLAFLER